MVKLVYTQDLKSCALNKRGGSIPSGGTGDWRNWLARTHGVREVAGSNPVFPTKRDNRNFLQWRRPRLRQRRTGLHDR